MFFFGFFGFFGFWLRFFFVWRRRAWSLRSGIPESEIPGSEIRGCLSSLHKSEASLISRKRKACFLSDKEMLVFSPEEKKASLISREEKGFSSFQNKDLSLSEIPKSEAPGRPAGRLAGRTAGRACFPKKNLSQKPKKPKKPKKKH